MNDKAPQPDVMQMRRTRRVNRLLRCLNIVFAITLAVLVIAVPLGYGRLGRVLMAIAFSTAVIAVPLWLRPVREEDQYGPPPPLL